MTQTYPNCIWIWLMQQSKITRRITKPNVTCNSSDIFSQFSSPYMHCTLKKLAENDNWDSCIGHKTPISFGYWYFWQYQMKKRGNFTIFYTSESHLSSLIYLIFVTIHHRGSDWFGAKKEVKPPFQTKELLSHFFRR